MAKEKKINDNSFALLALVAIVAIVAVVFMVSQMQTTDNDVDNSYMYEEVPVYDEAGNLVGEAALKRKLAVVKTTPTTTPK